MNLIAIDPGINKTGIAVFTDGVLKQSRLLTSLSASWDRLEDLRDQLLRSLQNKDHAVVVELPQIYRAVKSKGDPNDLIKTATVGAYLLGVLCESVPVTQTTFVHPGDWCKIPKSTKKGAVSARTDKILASLSVSERDRVLVQHDVIDAVGIGLWKLGRFTPKNIFPGATNAKST
jgi:hypothetical protein